MNALKHLDASQRRLQLTISGLAFSFAFFIATNGIAQPPMRYHTANSKKDLNLVRAYKNTSYKNLLSTKVGNYYRSFTVNAIPKHQVGQFPNRGNPHYIRQVKATYKVSLTPRRNKQLTPVGMNSFGITVNGILFDPAAAEFYKGKRSWQYEALGGAVPLGLDENYAHVQPNGQYHYHGLPVGLLQNLKVKKDSHSPLVGWAADGHPVYALYGFENFKDAKSKIKLLKSSYRLKDGDRPSERNGGPGGKHDGTFVNDYEFVEGHGDLDECNGRFTVTPEFPDGTYAYFLTGNWPVIPRYYRGTPDSSFKKQPQGGRRDFRGGKMQGGKRGGQGGRNGLPPRGAGRRGGGEPKE